MQRKLAMKNFTSNDNNKTYKQLFEGTQNQLTGKLRCVIRIFDSSLLKTRRNTSSSQSNSQLGKAEKKKDIRSINCSRQFIKRMFQNETHTCMIT